MKLEWRTCLRLGITIFILYLATQYWGLLMAALGVAVGAAFPLILGALIAYIVNILMAFYENFGVWKKPNIVLQKLKRPICMILAFLSILLVVVLIVVMIIPELTGCIQVLIEKLPGAISHTVKWAEENFNISLFSKSGRALAAFSISQLQDAIKTAADFLVSGMGGAMGSVIAVVSAIFSTLITLLVAFIFSIYLLASKEKLQSQILRLMQTYMGDKLRERVLYVVGTVHESFHNYIVGQCIEAVVIGVLCTLGMYLLRLPYASMVGCLVGFTALIPMAGAYIGAAIGAFMIFTVSPIQAVGFLVYLVILQQLEDNIIYPRVVGASIGLPGVWVLAAITIGGGVLGISGLLFGVPVAAALYKMLRTDVQRREGIVEETQEKLEKKKKHKKQKTENI